MRMPVLVGSGSFVGLGTTTVIRPCLFADSTSEASHSVKTSGVSSSHRFKLTSRATSSQSPFTMRSQQSSNSLPVGGSLLIHMVTPFLRLRTTWHKFFTSRRTPGILRLVPTTISASGRDLVSAFMTDAMASSSGLCSL